MHISFTATLEDDDTRSANIKVQFVENPSLNPALMALSAVLRGHLPILRKIAATTMVTRQFSFRSRSPEICRTLKAHNVGALARFSLDVDWTAKIVFLIQAAGTML